MKGSMRERTAGVWEVRAFVGTDPVTGAKRTVSRTVRGGKRQAQRALAELIAEQPHRRAAAPARMTLMELVEQHIDRHPGSPTTLTGYRVTANKNIKPYVGRLPITKIDAGILDQYYEYLIREKHLAPSTVRQIHAIIRGALSRAVKWGWVQTNPARDASPPTIRRSEQMMPTVDQVAKAIAAATEYDRSFGVFVRLAATTGARRGELCALTWTALDLDRCTVRIDASSYSAPGGLVLIKDTKNHSKRHVSLDPSSAASLRAHRARMKDRAGACGATLSADSFVFSDDADGHKPWHPDHVTGAWTRLRKRIGLDGVRLHDLRHFQATMLLQNGIPVKDVSRRIGHRDAATTLNVYAHWLETTDRRSADVIGSLFGEGSPNP